MMCCGFLLCKYCSSICCCRLFHLSAAWFGSLLPDEVCICKQWSEFRVFFLLDLVFVLLWWSWTSSSVCVQVWCLLLYGWSSCWGSQASLDLAARCPSCSPHMDFLSGSQTVVRILSPLCRKTEKKAQENENAISSKWESLVILSKSRGNRFTSFERCSTERAHTDTHTVLKRSDCALQIKTAGCKL